MNTTTSKPQKAYALVPIASAAALVLLGASPSMQATETPTSAASSPAPAAVAAQAQPTPEQIEILHQMDPALHAGMGHPPGHEQGPHDCPHACTQAAPTPSAAHPESKSATVNGSLTIKTPEGTRTLTISEVVHNGAEHCFWPVGGSIHLTGADNVAHTAVFAPACGQMTLDGANLTLPTRPKHPHGGPAGPRHKFGKQPPHAPDAEP